MVAGFKGLNFLSKFHCTCQVEFVASYKALKAKYNFHDEIESICLHSGYKFLERKGLSDSVLASADLIFIAGWQYLISPIDKRYIVIHDSLLPKFRGFSPTVTALILGEKKIGVTALNPRSDSIDTGDIYEQSELQVEYPLKIKDAYSLLSDLYVDVASRVLAKVETGSLNATPQEASQATHSLWRDEEDYYINWDWSAEKIFRFVDAVGFPYDGAKAFYKHQIIYIDQVSIGQNCQFEDRQPGKIWRINQGQPEVVCASGIIRILSARYEDGSPVIFDRLRIRLNRR
ncbi:methionyl-tRNA formyltransferase [Leptolyngbyaceae cyanobacterium UHCC 1019]